MRNITYIIQGTPGQTETQDTSDTAESLSDLGFTLTRNGRDPSGAIVTIETNNVRIAFDGAAPTQAGLGHLLEPGDSIRLNHPHEVSSIQFISASNGAPGTIQLTLTYGDK